MKNLTKEQQSAILKWMEDRINRPFREAFASAFQGVDEVSNDQPAKEMSSKPMLESATLEHLKSLTSIKQVREFIDTIQPKTAFSIVEGMLVKYRPVESEITGPEVSNEWDVRVTKVWSETCVDLEMGAWSGTSVIKGTADGTWSELE